MSEWTYINLTLHPVRFRDGRVIPPSGTVAKLFPTFGAQDGDLFTAHIEEPKLPEPMEGVRLIVSLPVLQLMWRERPDLVSPAFNHQDNYRDTQGQPVVAGVFSFHKL